VAEDSNTLRERVEQVLYAVQNDTWDLIPREPEGRFHLGTAAILVASYRASAGYRGFQ
jgi:hypothetical protein